MYKVSFVLVLFPVQFICNDDPSARQDHKLSPENNMVENLSSVTFTYSNRSKISHQRFEIFSGRKGATSRRYCSSHRKRHEGSRLVHQEYYRKNLPNADTKEG